MKKKSWVRIKVWVGKAIFYLMLALWIWDDWTRGNGVQDVYSWAFMLVILGVAGFVFSIRCEVCKHLWYAEKDQAKCEDARSVFRLLTSNNILVLRMDRRCPKCGAERI